MEINGVIYTVSDAAGEGCNAKMHPYSVLANPVLSSVSIKAMSAFSPVLGGSGGDTVTLSITVGVDTYKYYIEKQRWLVVRTDRTTLDGTRRYSYYYSEHEGLPVLDAIVVADNTTLTPGGYRFYNIVVNGQQVPGSVATASHGPSESLHTPTVRGAGRAVVVRWGHVHRNSVSLSIIDSRGRRVFQTGGHVGNTFTWRGVTNSGALAPSGHYLLRWHDTVSAGVVPLTWIR